MVGTHADSLLAEAVLKGFGPGIKSPTGEVESEATFTEEELKRLWAAAWKDASVPPRNDASTVYPDREEVRELDHSFSSGALFFSVCARVLI